MAYFATNPHNNYLSALARLKAEEAQRLQAESLHLEEDALRYRLAEIQDLKLYGLESPRYRQSRPSVPQVYGRPVYEHQHQHRQPYQPHSQFYPLLGADSEAERLGALIVRREEARRQAEQKKENEENFLAEYRRVLKENQVLNQALAAQQLQRKGRVSPRRPPIVAAPKSQGSDIDQLLSAILQFGAQTPPKVQESHSEKKRDWEQAPQFRFVFQAPRPSQSEGSTKAAQDMKEPSPKQVRFTFKPEVNATRPESRPQPTLKKSSADSSSLSLKEQLEARLYSDESNEIRDTIQALLASLADAASTGVRVAPTPKAAEGAASSPKGKEKAIPKESAESSQTTSIGESVAIVRSIEEAFNTLESEFTFPTQLDFTASAESDKPKSDAASDISTSSATSKLAFTARNQPIKYYEQSLTNLLLQLDNIESFGDENLRHMRKEVVARVEKALEDFEAEVEGRWITKVNKEQREQENKSQESSTAVAVSEEPQPASEPVSVSEALETEYEETLAAAEVEAAAPVASEQFVVNEAVETLAEIDSVPSVVDTEVFVPSGVSVTPVTPASDEVAAPAQEVEATFVTESQETVRPYIVEEEEPSSPSSVSASSSDSEADAFLLHDGGDKAEVAKSAPEPEADETGSDWSEVEA